MPTPRTGSVEPFKRADGSTYYRARIRHVDGFRERVDVPEKHCTPAGGLTARERAEQWAFRTVVFDFANVETIGQAFADEIFRVFARRHPEMDLYDINATASVEQMISLARAEPSTPAATPAPAS
jgi:STAS-like domain of unknown function (DUF4325)